MNKYSAPNSEHMIRLRGSQAKAEKLRALHHGSPILVLANVWDAVSARIVEESGATAIATTSAGIANMLGYADGQNIPAKEMLWMVQRIASSVCVPVTADLEAGYATTPADMAAITEGLLESGAVGLNLEDHHPHEEELVELSLQVEKIVAVLRTGKKYGVPLVVNARTDVFMPGIRKLAEPLKEAIQRANAYRAAGADCIFVPGVTEMPVIRQLLAGSPGPLNVLATPTSPSAHELEAAGVRRVSIGSGAHRATVGFHRRFVTQVIQGDSFHLLGEDTLSYAELNRLFGNN